MHGKTKLKLENENYRDEKCVTQAAWMKRTNENYERESIQIKSIPMNCMQTKKSLRLKKCIRNKIIRIKSIRMESIQMISMRMQKSNKWKVYE